MTTEDYFNLFDNDFSADEKRLIIEFFIGFSRFEFALKASGFVNQIGSRVSANWDAFVSSISNNFDQTKSPLLNDAVDFILNHPPRVQTIIGGQIVWINRNIQANEPLINKLRLHISDIRNNLFHGGKFNTSYQAEIARNTELLQSALVILNDWLVLDANVYNNFSTQLF